MFFWTLSTNFTVSHKIWHVSHKENVERITYTKDSENITLKARNPWLLSSEIQSSWCLLLLLLTNGSRPCHPGDSESARGTWHPGFPGDDPVDSSSSEASVTLRAQTLTSRGLGGTCQWAVASESANSNSPEAAQVGQARNLCSCAPYCKTAVMKKGGELQGNSEAVLWAQE